MRDFLHYWPEWEFWVSWPTIVTLGVAMGAVMIGFVTNRWGRAFGITILAFFTLYAIALNNKISTEPERTYAYLVVPPADNQTIKGGEVQLWTRANGVLNDIKACALRAADYERNHPFTCWYFDAPQGIRPPRTKKLVQLGVGDWIIDVDGPGHKQTVMQWLSIRIDVGRAKAIASKVMRKSNGEILCETPERDGVPLC